MLPYFYKFSSAHIAPDSNILLLEKLCEIISKVAPNFLTEVNFVFGDLIS